MDKIKVSYKRGPAERLNQLPIKDGQLIITKDTGEFYHDISNTERIKITDTNKQDKTDNRLNTEHKDIVDAINEINNKQPSIIIDQMYTPDSTNPQSGIAVAGAISNFITKSVNDLVNYYLKSETYTQAEVNSLISMISTASFEVVQTLPIQDIQTNVIYLVPKSSSQTQNVYDEYIYVNNAWEKIGDTQIDLSGYVRKTQEGYTGIFPELTVDGGIYPSSYSGDSFIEKHVASWFTASTAELYWNKIVQCTSTSGLYTEGYFYKAVFEQGNYVWQRWDVQPHQNLSGYQTTANLVTSLPSSSTDTQYPSAKCVYDLIGDIETALQELGGNNPS